MCVCNCVSILRAESGAGHSQCGPRNIIMFSVILNRKYLYHDDSVSAKMIPFFPLSNIQLH